MPRQRYQRGSLRINVPRHGNRPERKLHRGEYWAQWYQYVRQPDGSEKRRQREKIITRELAESRHIAKDYSGPLTKSDAQRVLDLLIAEDSAIYVPPDTAATVAMVASEYLALSEPNWGPRMVPVASLTEPELQSWLNGYVSAGASKSMLKKLLMQTRAIFKHARKKGIMTDNPTEDLRAKSKRRESERYLSIDECRRLLSVLTGRDHLIVRLAIQLGLRPEEIFALRRDDVGGDQLRIDEALIEGHTGPAKTAASDAFVYIPPDLAIELQSWLESSEGEPTDWLFQTAHGRPGFLNANNYRERILQPVAKRAELDEVNFQVLRRTCATLFGNEAKDPKSTQAQLRHADPSITLKHYQKATRKCQSCCHITRSETDP